MNTLDKFQKVRDYLNAVIYERSDEIDAMLAALASGNHVFMIGLPGTAKSLVTNSLIKCFKDDATYFQKLLTAETQLNEIFGPVSISELKNDKFKLVTDGYLADSAFAFLDEIWKCNSQLLNALLTILEERRFDNGNEKVQAPLVSLFSASNELPQDDSLQALYDRFMVRLEIKPISDNDNFLAMIDPTRKLPSPPKVLTLDDLRQAQKEIEAVDVSEVLPVIGDVRSRFRAPNNGMSSQVYVSDRRWRGVVKYLQAFAWLSGADKVDKNFAVYMADCLWEKPDQRDDISNILSEYVDITVKRSNEDLLSATALIDAAMTCSGDELDELYARIKSARDDIAGRMAVNPELAPHLQRVLNKYDAAMAPVRERYVAHLGL